MTVDEKALREHLAPFWKKLCATAEIPGIVASVAGDELISLFLAYEAAKPVPASGGVEAAEIKRITDWLLERNREHLYADGLLLRRHAGDAEKFLDTAILLSTLAALASSTPAEASCDDQLAEAKRLAANVGYMVVPDPVHADGEVHEPDLVVQMQPSLRALGFHAVPINTPAEAGPASSPATMEGVRELRLALANLTDAFLNRHGCFPLDKTNDKERHWCAAMSEAYRLVGQPNTPARYTALASSTPADPLPLEPTDRDRIATIIQNAIAEYCTWDRDDDCVTGTGPASYKAADRILSALSPAPVATSTSGEGVTGFMAQMQYRQAVEIVNRMTDGEVAEIMSQMVTQITDQAKEIVGLRAALSPEAKERS